MRVVEADRELTIALQNGKYLAEWNSGANVKPVKPWFDWNEGNIHTKNPEPDVLRKMLQLAARLSGRVHGNDGEIYDETSESEN